MKNRPMNFEQFNRQVSFLAKRGKVGYMVPNSDVLWQCWTANVTPEQAVAIHCNETAWRERSKM